MEWKNLLLKAVAEENDILGRKKGEALWKERFSEEDLAEIKSTLGASIFSAMYQQEPISKEDSYFQLDKVKYFNNTEEEIINDCYVKDNFIFLSVDPAASIGQNSDYTAIAVCGKNKAKDLFVYDMIRCKINAGKHDELIESIAKRYNTRFIMVESITFQSGIAQNLQDMGYEILLCQLKQNKKERAVSLASVIVKGNFYLKSKSNWINDLLIEMEEFNYGQHDDQVDALSYAAKAELLVQDGTILSMKLDKRTAREIINSF